MLRAGHMTLIFGQGHVTCLLTHVCVYTEVTSCSHDVLFFRCRGPRLSSFPQALDGMWKSGKILKNWPLPRKWLLEYSFFKLRSWNFAWRSTVPGKNGLHTYTLKFMAEGQIRSTEDRFWRKLKSLQFKKIAQKKVTFRLIFFSTALICLDLSYVIHTHVLFWTRVLIPLAFLLPQF